MLGLASCSKPSPGAVLQPTLVPTPVEESLIGYFPFKTGNTWEYEGTGMEYASYIQKVVNESGNRYQITMDNGATVSANVVEVDNDKIVNTYREGEAYDNTNVLNKPSNINIIILMTPLKKGTFWISEGNHYEIIQTDAAVTVPAGSFKDCIVVKATFKDQTSHMNFYFRQGIGLVQSEFVPDKGDLITSKLKKYNIQ